MAKSLAYAAGFVDGEGSIGFYSSTVRLTVVNTNLPVLRWFQRLFGGSITAKRARSSQHRRAFHWVVAGARARAALAALIPHLREKRPQARLALRIAGMPPARRAPHVLRLSALKHKEYTL